MKKILLALAMLPLAAQAQINEFSINTGPAVNIPIFNDPVDEQYPGLSYAANVNFRHIVPDGRFYGGMVEYTNLRTHVDVFYTDSNGNFTTMQKTPLLLGRHSIGIHAIGGKAYQYEGSSFSFGMSIGYVINRGRQLKDYGPNPTIEELKKTVVNVPDNEGFAIGSFINYTKFLNENTGIVFGLSPKLHIIRLGGLRFMPLSVPVTVGVRVRL